MRDGGNACQLYPYAFLLHAFLKVVLSWGVHLQSKARNEGDRTLAGFTSVLSILKTADETIANLTLTFR